MNIIDLLIIYLKGEYEIKFKNWRTNELKKLYFVLIISINPDWLKEK